MGTIKTTLPPKKPGFPASPEIMMAEMYIQSKACYVKTTIQDVIISYEQQVESPGRVNWLEA